MANPEESVSNWVEREGSKWQGRMGEANAEQSWLNPARVAESRNRVEQVNNFWSNALSGRKSEANWGVYWRRR